jgi:hypothetical protein
LGVWHVDGEDIVGAQASDDAGCVQVCKEDPALVVAEAEQQAGLAAPSRQQLDECGENGFLGPDVKHVGEVEQLLRSPGINSRRERDGGIGRRLIWIREQRPNLVARDTAPVRLLLENVVGARVLGDPPCPIAKRRGWHNRRILRLLGDLPVGSSEILEQDDVRCSVGTEGGEGQEQAVAVTGLQFEVRCSHGRELKALAHTGNLCLYCLPAFGRGERAQVDRG